MPAPLFLLKAESLARHYHNGQFRLRTNRPYINHPSNVAYYVRKVLNGTNEEIAAAWLHDVVEDTRATFDDLLYHDIPAVVVGAVSTLTKRKGESDYQAYLVRVKSDPIARKVKIADIIDNLSDHPTTAQLHRYSKALAFLVSP